MATINKSLLIGIVFIGILFLNGCSTVPATQGALNQQMNWSQRVKQLQSLQQWTLHGAIGIRIPDKAWSASLRWQQHYSAYTLNLFGPLGIGSVVLSGKPGFAQLKTAKGEILTANNPNILLDKATGWRLPISNLRYWIRGLPVPGLPAKKQFDRYHHLSQLQQQGWTIQFLRYTSINGIDVPSKLSLHDQQLKVKIVISQWQM